MKWTKRFLPKTLFWRGLLIVALPMVLVQVVTVYVFFDRHIDTVSRYMRSSLAGEIGLLTELIEKDKQNSNTALVNAFENHTGVDAQFLAGINFSDFPKQRAFSTFRKMLEQRVQKPVHIFRDKDQVVVLLAIDGGILKLETSAKRLETQTVDLFLLWSLGSSMLFVCIALLFLRGQVRPIQELAEASERFGKGLDVGNFKPSGANEVRRAGRAFMVMRERIQRQIRTRTQMLDGISHDLRTPLTRMKLQLEMQPSSKDSDDLKGDIRQMEAMLNEYLDYAKGGAGEDAVPVVIADLLKALVEDALRHQQRITLHDTPDATLMLREHSIRRMLENIISNARTYATKLEIYVHLHSNALEIVFDDDGPGIPQAMHEEVFRPFTRLDLARNINEGGVGLGLTIALDTARRHGGDMQLAQSPQGGLRVIVTLPL